MIFSWRKKREDSTELATALRDFSDFLESSQSDPQSQTPSRLSFFVLSAASRTLAEVLRIAPEARDQFSAIAPEVRYHFDSTWWLYLISVGGDEEQIAKLFPSVAYGITTVAEQSLERQAVVGPTLGQLSDPEVVTSESTRAAFSEYVLGEVPPGLAARLEQFQGDTPLRNAVLLSLKLYVYVPGLARSGDELLSLLVDQWKHQLLTGFDIDRCQFIEFPPDLLE